MPKALEDRPILGVCSEQYLEAFLILGRFRNESGNLEFEDIVTYARVIEESDVLGFVSVIMELDKAFKSAQEEKKNTDIQKTEPENG